MHIGIGSPHCSNWIQPMPLRMYGDAIIGNIFTKRNNILSTFRRTVLTLKTQEFCLPNLKYFLYWLNVRTKISMKEATNCDINGACNHEQSRFGWKQNNFSIFLWSATPFSGVKHHKNTTVFRTNIDYCYSIIININNWTCGLSSWYSKNEHILQPKMSRDFCRIVFCRWRFGSISMVRHTDIPM